MTAEIDIENIKAPALNEQPAPNSGFAENSVNPSQQANSCLPRLPVAYLVAIGRVHAKFEDRHFQIRQLARLIGKTGRTGARIIRAWTFAGLAEVVEPDVGSRARVVCLTIAGRDIGRRIREEVADLS